MVICYPHKVERPVAAHTILTEQYKQIKKCIISGAIVSVLSNHFDPGSGAKYCDQGVCMSLRPSVRSHPLAYLKNYTSEFHQIFCTCYLWPWLDLL